MLFISYHYSFSRFLEYPSFFLSFFFFSYWSVVLWIVFFRFLINEIQYMALLAIKSLKCISLHISVKATSLIWKRMNIYKYIGKVAERKKKKNGKTLQWKLLKIPKCSYNINSETRKKPLNSRSFSFIRILFFLPLLNRRYKST